MKKFSYLLILSLIISGCNLIKQTDVESIVLDKPIRLNSNSTYVATFPASTIINEDFTTTIENNVYSAGGGGFCTSRNTGASPRELQEKNLTNQIKLEVAAFNDDKKFLEFTNFDNKKICFSVRKDGGLTPFDIRLWERIIETASIQEGQDLPVIGRN